MTVALVTGGAGFIGSHVARALLDGGSEVVVLDDLSGGYRDNVPRGAVMIEGSVCDAALVARIFAEHRVREVFHLAAYAAEGLSPFIRRFNYTNNVIGSVNLINEAVRHEVDCFVFTSSIAVYGAGQLPLREGLAPRPEDPYGIAKYAVELDLAAAHEQFGLDSVIFRPHNVYGEHQNTGDRYRNVVGIFMARALQGGRFPVFGDGSQTRAFTYVADVAPAIARATRVPGARNQVFNIGTDQVHSVRDLALKVAQVMGVAPDLEMLPARKEVQHAFSDHARMRAVFGTDNDTPLAEGLARMAEWVRRVGVRSGRPFRDIEITRGLPPSWLNSL